MTKKKTVKPCDEAGTILKHAMQLLEQDTRSISDICADIGVPFHWLTALTQNRMKNPSVNRIEYLIIKLSGNKETTINIG